MNCCDTPASATPSSASVAMGWYLAYPWKSLDHNRHNRSRTPRAGAPNRFSGGYGNALFADGHVATRTDEYIHGIAVGSSTVLLSAHHIEPWYARNYDPGRQGIF